MEKNNFPIFLFLFLFFQSSLTMATENEKKNIFFDEIIVTATKTKMKDVSASAYVITKEDIEQTDSRNIEEALEKIPGIFTEDKFHGEYNVISFRGAGLHSHVTRGILVLLDGIPINEATGRVDFEGIDLENVEKIEVLKGPVSALYGPNGITGVINIITKDTLADFGLKIKGSAGSFNTKKITATGGGMIKEYGLHLNTTHYFTHGYRKHNSYETDKISAKVDRDFYKYGDILLSMDYIVSKKDVTGPLSKEQYKSRSRENTKKFAKSDIDLFRLGITHDKIWGKKFNTKINLYFRNKKHGGGYLDTFTSEDDLNLFGTEVKLYKPFNFLGKKNCILSGISAAREKISGKSFGLDFNGNKTDLTKNGKGIYEIIGCYIQDDYNIFDSLILTLGTRSDTVRYDWKDRFVSDGDSSGSTSISAWSPKLALAYTPAINLTIFGNIGKGFNPPQISQLFIGGYGVTPNPDLEPEYLTNYEFGLRGDGLEVLKYQVSFFWMEFKDQILKDDVTGKYENIGETRHKGMEATADLKFSENILFSINYAYLNAKFTDYSDYSGNHLKKTPKHQAGAILKYSTSAGLTVNISLKWMDEYYMDNKNVNTYKGHYLVNTKVTYKWKRYFTSLSINNLFDTKYATWASASNTKGKWTESYYPGWPFNLIFTAGLKF